MANVKNVKNVKEQNVETLNTKEAFFLKYKKPIIAAICAIVLIFAGVVLYKNFVSGPREDEASTALGKCQELFMNQQYNDALNGNKSGCAGFLKVASDYSSTKAGNLANLYAGLCYANLDKWNEAIKYLDEYSPANDAMVSPAALAALGNAYAHTNQLDKAVSSLESAADKADKQGKDGINNSLSPTFRLQAALILESQGKKDEALKMYEEIKKKYTTSSLVQSQEIDKYIQRLSAK